MLKRIVPAALGMLCLSSTWAYQCGDNILKNGRLERPDQQQVPADWEKMIQETGAKAVCKVDDGGIMIYFTNPDNMIQTRIKQTVQLELGKVYEFTYEYRSGNNIALNADACMLGTGTYLRAWWQAPATNWTKVKGLFYMPPTVPEKGKVIVMLQNRSMIPLWYRNISLRVTDLKQEDIPRQIPELKVHSVTTDDIFIMPETKAKSANYILIGMTEETLKKFAVNAELFVKNDQAVRCDINGLKIAVPMSAIPDGKSTLVVKLSDRADNSVVAVKKLTLERLMKMPEGMDFSRNENIKNPDGKPFFPIGIYAAVGWNFSVEQMKNYGFNVVHCYGFCNHLVLKDEPRYNPQVHENNLKIIKDAERLGIYVMMSLPPIFAEKGDKVNLLAAWQKLYRDYPSVLSWYVDEMKMIRNTPMPVYRNAYNTIKKQDPKRQWYAYEKPDPELADCMDVMMTGINSPAMIKIIKLKLGAEKPIIHVYGQIDYMNSVASSLEYNQYNFVMPVIWGARGIFYFMYDNLWDVKANPHYKVLAERVLNTSRRFAPVGPAIVSGEPLPAWTQNIKITGNMERAVFALGDKTYIFCGVADSSAAAGKLSVELPKGHSVRDVLNDKALPPQKVFEINYAPGHAGIFEIK